MKELPEDLAAAVLVVLHIPPNAPSLLPELLSRASPLPAANARDDEPLHAGHIYVAPLDRHLLVERTGEEGAVAGRVRLSAGPRENHSRPALDPLFRSAALAFGPRVIGVVLSGALTDGTAGLWDIKQRGGTAVVQDPGDALYLSMPHSALDQVPVDYVLPSAEIPALLVRLVEELRMRDATSDLPQTDTPRAASDEGERAMPEGDEGTRNEQPGSAEVRRDRATQIAGERDGEVAVYVCPDCGGTLWQVNAGPFPRFR